MFFSCRVTGDLGTFAAELAMLRPVTDLFIIVSESVDLPALAALLASQPALSTLFVQFDRLGAGCGLFLAETLLACRLARLDVCRFYDSDITALCDALAVDASLASLSFSASHFPDLAPLGLALRYNCALKTLKIDDCCLSDVSALGAALQVNASLTELSLCYNHIEDVRSIAFALLVNPCLATLRLEHNLIADVELLCHALSPNRALDSLYLHDNRVRDVSEFAVVLSIEFRDCVFVTDAFPPRGPTCGLRLIDLTRNDLSEKCAAMLAEHSWVATTPEPPPKRQRRM
jgi:hypothetical protein